MRTLLESELALASGGADEPNPGQASAGGVLIGAGVAVVAQAGGGTAVFSSSTAIPGVGAAVLAGTGGYLVGDYVEQKTGAGTALYNFIWKLDGYAKDADLWLRMNVYP